MKVEKSHSSDRNLGGQREEEKEVVVVRYQQGFGWCSCCTVNRLKNIQQPALVLMKLVWGFPLSHMCLSAEG